MREGGREEGRIKESAFCASFALTGKTFSTMTVPSSNYYRVKPVPSLDDLSEGDVLQFKVSAGTESGAIDYHISVSDLDRGALHFNITFGEGGFKVESSAEEEQAQTPVQTPLLPPLPQGPISTPVTTPTPGEGQTLTPTSMPAVLPSEEEMGIPGFEAPIAIVSLFILFMLLDRRKRI